MVKKPLSLDQDVINSLKTDYGIEVASLKFLSIGADIHASVYKAEAHNQSSYFVKLRSGHQQDISLIILTQLHEAGIPHIIPPIKTSTGQSSSHVREFTLIVYPFIDGQDGFARNLTDIQWITLGKTLRQVHEFKVPSSVLDHVRRETYSNKWRMAVRSLYTHIEAEPKGDIIALKLLESMKMHRLTIQRLVDRSEALSQKIQNQSPEFVLCHSDIHGGNVIVADNGTIHIVDWDEPILAPKERDLMFIGGGVANVWNNPHEVEFFYRGYGKTEINKDILAYYRHERIVEDIAVYGQSLLLTSDGNDREIMYKHFIAMFEPRGVVDIAFKTEEL
ncbi:aminoglycoside phosphotransferase family protein [Candidatus Protochlamydia phocaeensis]|uniref:aminoglycoside phosphotransferase family protein n=1 Tax=Candidatus Protochlamydia phocaeensis TaxID=1414722 RepID=UPI000839980E|nr:aminoglycoside phosphotransferase family protein [Candidatus Protochlamydia phocaeensis]